MPRTYDMSKRALAREETRRRIVEATAKLHGERGVFGTTWRDIAKEADVAVATVYSHFPSLDELLPACGAHVMERIQPPAPRPSRELFDGADSLEARFERVAGELFGFYERGGAHIEVDVRERQIAGMREWEQFLLDMVTARVKAAMAPRRPSARTVALVSALFDLSTFRALRNRGVAPATAARTMAQAAVSVAGDTPKGDR
jgi:AcrR family transcriptional regulator